MLAWESDSKTNGRGTRRGKKEARGRTSKMIEKGN